MDRETLINLTADIVASHVANNSTSIADVSRLVETVHEALSDLSQPRMQSTGKTPVVPIKGSVKPDAIVCLECGRKQKMLKRHLQTAHGLTPEQYRSDYGLTISYPMTTAAYSQLRRNLAIASGLGKKSAKSNAKNASRSKTSS